MRLQCRACALYDSVFPCDPPRGRAVTEKAATAAMRGMQAAKERCAETIPKVSIAHVRRKRLGAEILGAAP